MSEERKIRKRKLHRMPVFLNLTTRFSLFLFLFIVLMTAFYFIGNSQKFIDENLVLILNIVRVSSFFLLIFSAASIAASIFYIFSKKNLLFLISVFIYLIPLVFSIFLVVAPAVITLLSGGIK